ncbi:restriction endonuclease subunit S [Belliella aquatica]|uniref:HsdS polypeptide n=1 Tax=Belliella aquatica TaxID=1323734 RepID=A0ABQ1MCN3_9BACT|nr:restriction endonuclease subunit S [Belliella aquatica]MCH7405264.1 restriction endonuclease subunit S [Belliella aquatica]GGC38385.1 HsdS polypeptide [Belliella aquatica]
MQLLEHFKELTLHPKNAEELKGLILQLAVQGKLTKQWRMVNSDVEPASVLLEKIEVEKDEFIKETKRRKEKVQLSITKEEEPFDLPISWEWSRMLNICHLITDGTHHTPKYLDNGIPFLSVKNLSQGGIDFSDTKFISLEEHKDLIKRCNPEYEDVLLTKIGTTGIAKVIDIKTDFSIFVSVALLKIAKQNLFPYFIEHCINSPFIKQQSKDGTEGVGNKNLVLRKIKDFLIPIPPLEEQKAIVAIVNQLFAEVEQLEAMAKERIQLKADFVTSALNQLTQAAEQDTASQWEFLQQHFGTFFTEKENIKKLREGVLQLAVQGKLTRDWRAIRQTQGIPIEHASTLLEKIKAEKSKLIKDKVFQKPQQSGEIMPDEFENTSPKSWQIAKIVDLCFVTKLAGFEYTKYIKLEDSGEIPVIRAQNVKMNRLDERNLKYIDKDTSELLYRCALTKPCLLMTFIGAGIGDVALFNKPQRWHLAPNVAKLEPFNYYEEKISPNYLLYYLMSPEGQKQIFKSSKATAQPSLSMGTIRDAIVTLPPLEEQKVIVDKVNTLMTLCDKLKKEIETHQTSQEQWMKSCLREVFEN